MYELAVSSVGITVDPGCCPTGRLDLNDLIPALRDLIELSHTRTLGCADRNGIKEILVSEHTDVLSLFLIASVVDGKSEVSVDRSSLLDLADLKRCFDPCVGYALRDNSCLVIGSVEALFKRNDLTALILNGRKSLGNHIGIRHIVIAVSVEGLGNIFSDDIIAFREFQCLETITILGYTVILPCEVICSFALAGSAGAFSDLNKFLVVGNIEEISLYRGNITRNSNCLGHVEPLNMLIVLDRTESKYLTVILEDEVLVVSCSISLLIESPTGIVG